METAPRKALTVLKVAAGIVICAVVASIITVLVSMNGQFPTGSDTMCHVYKGSVLYHDILEGNWYPLYDEYWYNGVEMLRYWAPLPVYFLAACQAVMGGNELDGYLMFVWLIAFLGALPWIRFGVRYRRVALGTFIGVLWFFMPNNLYALFGEGNLPRSLCMVLLPLFVHYIYTRLFERDWSALPKMIACFALMALCHLGYAGMIAIAYLVFYVVYSIAYRDFKSGLDVFACMVCAFLLIGIWAFASLVGGLTSTDSSQVMKGFFQDALVTINPIYRLTDGVGAAFYFGLAALVLAVFGLMFSGRKRAIAFGTAILIFLCTTTTAYYVLVLLPGSEYLWMLRFISIALCLILYAFLMWATLRKVFTALICVLLAVDTVPSLSQVYGLANNEPVAERLAQIEEDITINMADEVTTQRAALLDANRLGATGAYLVSGFGGALRATFGAGWQSAATGKNIMLLNQALEDGDYLYLFDRCKELGNDSVILRTTELENGAEDRDKAVECAKESGYTLVAETQTCMLLHLDGAPDRFGVKSTYPAIGIGDSASNMSLLFPAIQETDSPNLNDYTFDQLSGYDMVFLSGFKYTDKQAAEDLVVQLSESGVKVVIVADRMPENQFGSGSFLGVTALTLNMKSGYPPLMINGYALDTSLFPGGYSDWKTVYLDGLDDAKGTLLEEGRTLAFYGTKDNGNIVFLGINLPFFYSLTLDKGVGSLLSETFGLSADQLPKRKVVSLGVGTGPRTIEIACGEDGVNTTLAFHDMFKSEQPIRDENNLLVVDRGVTVIEMDYPCLWQGVAMSCSGVLLTTLFLVLTWRSRRRWEVAQTAPG